jgi:adenine-specific DNA-methyltransferase
VVTRGRRVTGKVIEQYEHRGAERVNNPPVGLVSPELNGVGVRRHYEYDPHLDPQLVWAGKARSLGK